MTGAERGGGQLRDEEGRLWSRALVEPTVRFAGVEVVESVVSDPQNLPAVDDGVTLRWPTKNDDLAGPAGSAGHVNREAVRVPSRIHDVGAWHLCTLPALPSNERRAAGFIER